MFGLNLVKEEKTCDFEVNIHLLCNTIFFFFLFFCHLTTVLDLSKWKGPVKKSLLSAVSWKKLLFPSEIMPLQLVIAG